MNRTFVALGSGLAFLAVALGAFGTHSLKDTLSPAMLEVWQKGVQYHLAHAIGLVLVGLLAAHDGGKAVRIAGWLLTAGIVIFGGTLYVYSTTGITAFAIVTPLGGLCFLAGWATLAVTFARRTNPS